MEQCETVDAENLKTSRLHIMRRMASLKSDFNTHFERLLEKLNTLTGEILLKCLGENPKKSDREKVSAYFVELQLEVTKKVQKLTRFQDTLNSHCTAVHVKIDYTDLSGPSVSQGPSNGGQFRGTIDISLCT